MNSRQVYAEADRLAAERCWPEGSPQKKYLLSLLIAREEARVELRLRMESLRRELDRLESMLKAPSPLLNNRGELQQVPAAIEAAVGEFTAADRALSEYLATWPGKAKEEA